MVQNRLILIIHFLRAQNEKILVFGAGAAWSRLFLPGARADLIWSEPESAPWLLRNTASEQSFLSFSTLENSSLSNLFPIFFCWIWNRIKKQKS